MFLLDVTILFLKRQDVEMNMKDTILGKDWMFRFSCIWHTRSEGK